MVDFLTSLGLSGLLAWTIAAIVSAVLVLNVIAGGALAFIWAERKVSARIQDRLGPTRTGGRFGWLQSLADGIKLLAKEDLMPDGADGLLFRLAPYVSFCASFCAFIALPFAFDVVGCRLNVAVFFVVAVLGLGLAASGGRSRRPQPVADIDSALAGAEILSPIEALQQLEAADRIASPPTAEHTP